MKAGKYWIGDLCYVLRDGDWDEVCSLIIDGDNVKDGEFKLSDGRKFAILSTYYGDGCYRDSLGNEYGVDSGSIGCILVENIKLNEDHLGHVHDINVPFAPFNDKGKLHFGDVVIDTNPKDEDWEEDEDWEDE